MSTRRSARLSNKTSEEVVQHQADADASLQPEGAPVRASKKRSQPEQKSDPTAQPNSAVEHPLWKKARRQNSGTAPTADEKNAAEPSADPPLSVSDQPAADNSSTDDKSADGEAAAPDQTQWKLVSWNVNGLRALMKKPTALREFVAREQPDALCLQETKLQDTHVADYRNVLPGYTSYWNVSKAKKGYSGTAIFSRVKPLSVQYGIGVAAHDNEGRTITAEYDTFYLVCVYVPNSGQKLDRLNERTTRWDPDFVAYLKRLEQTKPVIVMGDLNVAHLDIDIHNPSGNRRSAGFTNEERERFTEWLNAGFVDSFRHLYPTATGVYTYWNYKFNAKANNKGWRLDYAVMSRSLLPRLHDFLIRKEVDGSDHVPVVLLLN